MAVATAQLTGFIGEVDRSAVLAHYQKLLATGLEKDEAITQTIDAIIHGGKAVQFVRAFGPTMIKGMISTEHATLHPSSRPAIPLPSTPVQPPESDDGASLGSVDAQTLLAPPSPPERIPQVFPEPGSGRVLNVAKLRDASQLTGVLAGSWSVDGKDVPLGLLTPKQCFWLSESETRRGRAHVTNGTMFRRLGQSLDPDQVVADRWDNAGIMIQFELAEPKLSKL